jgi:5'/3'-nucleotidase
MRILCCNDDGIDARGLRLLADAARALADDVWIVAPERKWTAASHHVTFDRDIVLTRRTQRTFACSGTPVDAVIAAMTLLDGGGLKPDLVLAGVNDKRNVGEDIAYSGTLAIAREATFWKVPAIALSRDAWPQETAGDVAALGTLLHVLWQSRAQWAAPGTWLALTLPASLPAPIRQASPAHDKIASATDIVRVDDAQVVYRLRRGRPGSAAPGDENDVMASGAIVVVRYAAGACVPLADGTLRAWESLLA